MSAPSAGEPRLSYRIGAVSRLTGLSTHTLRKWEDRHALIAPRRSDGGERLYSGEDVQRLCLARDLAHAGTPLSTLAALDTAELERLRDAIRRTDEAGEAAGRSAPLGVAILGTALPTLVSRHASSLRHSRLLGSAADLPLLAEILADVPPDVLVVERPALSPDTPGEIAQVMERLHARAVVVVYNFGSHADVAALRTPDVAPVRAPLDPLELERHCLGLAATTGMPVAPPPAPAGTARQFSRQELARIAGMRSNITCECPRHLAELIMSLDAFEAYSAGCEHRDARDAALHRHLHQTARAGRVLLEEALTRVIDEHDAGSGQPPGG